MANLPSWLDRGKRDAGNKAATDLAQKTVASAGAFVKCAKCHHLLVTKDFERDWKVCSRCGHHHPLTADERIESVTDNESFVERDAELRAADPLEFPQYADKIASGTRATGRPDTLVSGTATIGGARCVLLVADFRFVGGSMGSVFGEKFARAAAYSIAERTPLIVFSASGGARMQEGLFGLMQMAKTSASVARLGEARVPYIVVLTDPTMGGALASFASLGDLIYAEPGARVAFAGTRVAQQAAQGHGPKPPANYQTAEFFEDHGMVDRIVPRKELASTLGKTLAFLAPQTGLEGA